MIDVKNKRCDHAECDLRPCYSKLFYPSISHCVEHASLNEFSYKKRNPICTMRSCINHAIYVCDNDPIRCHEHRLATDIKLLLQQCPNCRDNIYYS